MSVSLDKRQISPLSFYFRKPVMSPLDAMLRLVERRFFIMPSDEPVSVRRVKLELLLQKGHPLRAFFSLPYVISMLALFYMRHPTAWILAWGSMMFLLKLYNYAELKKLEAHERIEDELLGVMLKRHTIYLFLVGSLWGLAPWMVMPHDDAAYIALMSTFMIGAISTGSAMLASHRQTVAAFIIPAGLGLIAALAWVGGLMPWILALAMVQFLAITFKWTFQQADLLTESLIVRFQKEELAQKLEHQVELVEDANREKSRFFASASHDLRQPMHAISLFTSVLERSRLDAQSVETVSRLGHSVNMLSQSLDTMLDVSRLDAGAVQPRLQALKIHDLFLSLHTTFAGRAQEKGLQLRFRAPGNLVVHSDALLLERLLGNLIDNAVKYTQNGGVLVAARALRNRRIRFEVIDSGIGIPHEYHELVFDEFYQLGNPHRDRRFGLGIGLSIVRRLSRLLDHPLEFQSWPGRGTRFRVWAPQADMAIHEHESIRQFSVSNIMEIESRLPRNVMVLDDEADSRQALAALLASYGCKVCSAGDIEQATKLLSKNTVDAVVADFRLPGEQNGLEFLLQVRTESPHIRTLLVTGETAPNRISAIKQSGMTCLYKPVLAKHLLEALVD